ncbi:hypothetical protein ACWX0P_29855 [Vibrio mediterranei]
MPTSSKVWSHQALCQIAAKWLKRAYSAGGAGCHIAFTEIRSGWDGEIPDAIGFRAAGFYDGSIVVEVKTSRSDFLADRKKPHRLGEVLGLGNWRYYLCPEGLILPHELPDRWGLVYVTKRGGAKPVVGAASVSNYGERQHLLDVMRFVSDSTREQFILVKLLNRIADPDKLNIMLKDANNRAQRLAKDNEQLRAQLRQSVPIRHLKTPRRTNALQ